MKSLPALPLLISCLLFSGCDQSTQEALQDKALSFAQVQLYEARLALDIEARRQELEVLKSVNNLAALQQAEKEIQAIQNAMKEKQAELPNPGRLSYQDEQKVDSAIKDEFVAVLMSIRDERTRIAGLEGVAEYQNKQNAERHQERMKSYYVHLDQALLTDKKQITEDPDAYLAAINEAMDDWRGAAEELEGIKGKLDQYLTLRPEDADGYLALAIVYSLKSAFKRSENLVKALNICSHFEKTAKDHPEVYVIKAGIQLRWDDNPSAHKALQKAGELGVDSFWYHYFQALVLLNQGEQQAGEEKLNALLNGDWRQSQLAYVQHRLSLLKLSQDKREESLARHEKAVALHPGFHWRHGNYGFALLRSAGDIENAEKQLNIARSIRSYGQLHRLEQEILFVKWANAKAGNMNPKWAPQLAAFNPTEKQMKAMMVRTGEFHHGPTIDALVKVLLKQNISMDTQSRAGRTAMHRAAEKGHVTTLDALYRHGASLEITDETGSTPLLAAIQKHRMVAANHLISLGANIKHEAPLTGATPLSQAVFGGHHELVKRLIGMGVNVNYQAPSRMGNPQETVLTTAVINGDELMVRILLEAGADQSVTVMGRTLPEAAEELGHETVVALLKG